jgi:nitrite reductase (cytochrome c-552)
MKSIVEIVEKKAWFGWALYLGTLGLVFALGLFAASILERRQESFRVQQVSPIPDWEPRNAVWGHNYPREYETYLATRATNFASKYAGSVEIDYLARHPKLVVLWAGYPFARDYKQARGHYHAVRDIRETLRTTAPLPATCWTCKSTDVPRVMNERGAAAFYRAKWADLGSEIVNHIGCQDCHDPRTMNLRITRPALAEALARRGEDIQQATHQQMRSLVCAQCHVEYYFKGQEDKYLTFPWDKGFSAEDMEAYYDALEFTDWTHALSKAPMLKAQHPDYELFRTGIHAQRGVSCADCHMPYKSEGGIKFSHHHLSSPLQNLAAACGVCHRESEATLLRDVQARQDRVKELLHLAEDALCDAHIEARAAWEAGASAEDMKPILTLLRHAQWRWDWVAAANGAGIHSPLEAARVLGTAIQKAERARRELALVLVARGARLPVPMPDLSTKEKAQAYVGLDMTALRAQKREFLEKVVPQWDAQAREREARLPKPPAGKSNY